MFCGVSCAHVVVTLVTLSVGLRSENNRWIVVPGNEVKSEAFDTPIYVSRIRKMYMYMRPCPLILPVPPALLYACAHVYALITCDD